MDIHNNDDDNDHRAATITNATHRKYTNTISRFCNWLAQQPSLRHTIRHDNNGDIVLIYNKLDAVTVKTYLGVHLRRRLRRYPVKSTVMNFHIAIQWGSRRANESLPRSYYDGIRYCRMKPFIIHKQICFGYLQLAVLLVRARKRANHRLYVPGGVGYERCREEFYNHASISEKINSNSG